VSSNTIMRHRPGRGLVQALAASRRASFLGMRTHSSAPLVVLGALIYGAIVALNVATLLMPPRLTLQVAAPAVGRARVAWVLPGGTLWDQGVRAGDAVHTVNGHAPLRRNEDAPVNARLTVRTGAGAILVVDAGTLRHGRDTWPLLVLSPWFLLLGTLVALRAPQHAVGRATYALFGSAAYALALAPAADNDDALATVSEWAMLALFAASFVLFSLTFPAIRGTRRLRASLLAPPAVGVLCGAIALQWSAWYDAAYLARMAILLAYLLLGIGLLSRSFAAARDPDTRRGLIIIGAGTAAAVLPFVLLYLLPAVLGRPPVLPAEQAILGLALLPAGFAYAILRHRALDVRLLQRWLVRGLLGATLLGATLFALYAAAVYALHARLIAALPVAALPALSQSLILAMLLVLLVGVSFRWAYDALWRRFDRLIFKDAYDYRATVQGLSRDLSLAGDLAALGASLPRELRRLMNLDFAALLVEDPSEMPAMLGTAGAYPPALLPEIAAATREAREAARVVALTHGYGSLPVLLVPLHTRDALVGYLCLGPKASGEPFRTEDRALLATLSGHLAAIVRNAQLVDELRGQVGLLQAQKATLDALNERLEHAQEEERARLAADLHDEPLQTAQRLQRQLAVDGRWGRATAQHLALGEQLITQLRAVCAAVRPTALDELGLAAAIEELAVDLGAHGGVPIALEADPELAEIALPPAVELVLYRAAQEALNNSLRHARPATLHVDLRRNGGGVQLTIADDGVGFAVPARPDGLVAAGHLGLGGLRQRVQRAGGHLSIASAPGAGTVVRVEFAVAHANGGVA